MYLFSSSGHQCQHCKCNNKPQETDHENGTKALMRDLKNGALDVVFSSEPENSREYETRPLFRQEIIVLVPKNHPLAQQKYIAPADLNEEDIIMHTEETVIKRYPKITICQKIWFSF